MCGLNRGVYIIVKHAFVSVCCAVWNTQMSICMFHSDVLGYNLTPGTAKRTHAQDIPTVE